MTATNGSTSPTARDPGGTRCVVLHPQTKGRHRRARSPEARLEEAVGLARAIGLTVEHAATPAISRRRPATLLGSGVVDDIGAIVAGRVDGNRAGEGGAAKIDVAVIDAGLTPIQQRNLETAWNCKVIDRAGLILEIFGARARTREGRLQVELAALTYQRSRLVRTWTHLERQRGGFGFMGGPGETQIEADRRQIDTRITRLKRLLKDVKRTRGLHRKARRRVPYPVIALVGYTNAGKSTLFNALTQARVDTRDMLFATLDPTMRQMPLPSGRSAILSDTVGFVSDLPHELVAAFHATLEEVSEADLVVHVRDAHHPDSAAQKDDVLKVLAELGMEDAAAAEGRMIEVLNKSDLLAADDRAILINRAKRANAPVVVLSAATGEGLERLAGVFDSRLGRAMRVVQVELAAGDGAAIAWLYAHGEVTERRAEDDRVHLTVRIDPANAERFARRQASA